MYVPSPKVVRGHLAIPSDRSGYRRARDGLSDNRRLNSLVESIAMNVGSLWTEVSRPPMKSIGVGAVIVLGA
jgi:hypothetical protein